MTQDEEIKKLKSEIEGLKKSLKQTTGENKRFTSSIDQANFSIRGLTTSIRGSEYGLKSLGKAFISSINPRNILQATRDFEMATMTMTRESMGLTREVADSIEQTMLSASNETALFGITIEDNMRMMKEINEVMKVNTFLTSQQIEGMQLLAKNSGVASSEIASMVENFANIGVGTDKAIKNISDMQKQARGYGINVGQFMKTIGTNMKVLSAFNFKNGIEGFSKMLAKAQALRIDVSNTFSLAEKFMDPEQAIETAAGFQMLGGAVGDLADPFKLLNMAQTDVGGLQDAILGMAESAVTFNKETGEFDIPVSEMYRLREAAKLTGKSYQEFSQDAIKAKQRTEKLKILDAFGQYTDEQKDLIANLSEFDGGELKVRVPGFDEAVNVANLGQEELQKLQDIQEESKLSDKDIALKQLSTLEYMAGLRDKTQLTGLNIGVSSQTIDDLNEVQRSISKGGADMLNEVFSPEKVKPITDSFHEAFKKGFTDSGLNAEFAGTLKTVFGNINSGISTLMETVSNNIDSENAFKSPELMNILNQELGNLGNTMTNTDLGGLINQMSTDIFNAGETLERQVSEQITLPRTEQNVPTTNEQDLITPINPSAIDSLSQFTVPTPKENTTPIVGDFSVNGNINLTINDNEISPDVLQMLMNNPDFKSAIERAMAESTTYND